MTEKKTTNFLRGKSQGKHVPLKADGETGDKRKKMLEERQRK